MLVIQHAHHASSSPACSDDTRTQAPVPRLRAAHALTRPLHLVHSATSTSTPTSTSSARTYRRRQQVLTMRRAHQGGRALGRGPHRRRVVTSAPRMQPRPWRWTRCSVSRDQDRRSSVNHRSRGRPSRASLRRAHASCSQEIAYANTDTTPSSHDSSESLKTLRTFRHC
jgi:hypothetical protein